MKTALTYDGIERLEVYAKRRGGWVHYDDGGAAVRLAGAPEGWLEIAQRIVNEEGVNVNRRGVIFVAAPEWREQAWHERLEQLVADRSVAVYEALLELDD